jgi:hypothetical protein
MKKVFLAVLSMLFLSAGIAAVTSINGYPLHLLLRRLLPRKGINRAKYI